MRGNRETLSGLHVWGLTFGTIIGFGAFVLPADTYLPAAGPLGTIIAIIPAVIAMLIIAGSFQYMMIRYPGRGGAFLYTLKSSGAEHGFFCGWFVGLCYISLVPMNATAMTLICRMLPGKIFEVGHVYDVAGYPIYMGEVAISVVAIVLIAFLCLNGSKLIGAIQAVLAIILAGGVIVIAVAAFVSKNTFFSNLKPMFSTDTGVAVGIMTVFSTMPWAFVGFDTISLSVERFRFPIKRSLRIMVTAILMGGGVYILNTLVTAMALPQGYETWTDFLHNASTYEGLKQLPLFNAANEVMGSVGVYILVASAFAAVLTGMIGFFLAGRRLMSAMAEKELLPGWFKKGGDIAPVNVVIFIALISCVGPFFGRTGLGWLVDIASLGAAVGFGYTSHAAMSVAAGEGNKKRVAAGRIGLILSVVFGILLLNPMGTLEPESYLMLGIWGTLGYVFFWLILKRNGVKPQRKRVLTVGISLMIVVIYSMTVWVMKEIHRFIDGAASMSNESYVNFHDIVHGRVFAILLTYAILLGIMITVLLAIYHTMQIRAEELESEKNLAEEGSRLKSEFLSNMSHDLRTPMNAIIGYTDMAREAIEDRSKTEEYLEKIYYSGRHLLELINNVLEMNMIENGRIELDEKFYDIHSIFDHMENMLKGQAEEKALALNVEVTKVRHPIILCDRVRLNQILVNLVDNAIKYTPEGGRIDVSVEEFEDIDDLHANYEIRVRDNGIGMSEEFSRHVFEPFEKEDHAKGDDDGSGLGLSIAKDLVELMDGMIDLVTRQGQGTEFIIHIPFRRKSVAEKAADGSYIDARMSKLPTDTTPEEKAWNFAGKKALLVDDNMINREIAKAILQRFGFGVEEAFDGSEAFEVVKRSKPGYYDVVLMDIQMPNMNGYDATMAIRSLPDPEVSRVPVIAMTANAFDEDVKKAHAAGMNDHVAKPIDIPELMRILEEVMS